MPPPAEKPQEVSPDVARVVLNATDALIAVLDDRDRIVLWNEACERATGLLSAKVLGRPLWSQLSEDGDRLRSSIDRAHDKAQPTVVECRWPIVGGGTSRIHWTFRPLVNERTGATHTVASGAVITRLRQAEKTLRAREQELSAIVDTLPIGFFAVQLDDDTGDYKVSRINQRCAEMVGPGPGATGPTELTAYIHPDDQLLITDAIESVIQERVENEVEVRVIRPDGEVRWIRAHVAPILDGDDDVVASVGTLIDINAEVLALQGALLLTEILESSTDLVVQFDAGGTVVYSNQATSTALGSPPTDAGDIFEAESVVVFHDEVIPTLADEGTWRGEMAVVTADGQKVPVSQLFVAHMDAEGRPHRVSMIARDISETKALQSELSHLAFHDPLTSLPNRSLLLDRLGQALHRIERSKGRLAVYFLDLDYFKSVNDDHGHDAGDELLKLAAQRLLSSVRPGDTVARLGGDEFVVLAEPIADAREAIRIAERIRSAVARPFHLDTAELLISTSIGIAISDDPTTEPETLISHADRASYQAKAKGRDRYEQYDQV